MRGRESSQGGQSQQPQRYPTGVPFVLEHALLEPTHQAGLVRHADEVLHVLPFLRQHVQHHLFAARGKGQGQRERGRGEQRNVKKSKKAVTFVRALLTSVFAQNTPSCSKIRSICRSFWSASASFEAAEREAGGSAGDSPPGDRVGLCPCPCPRGEEPACGERASAVVLTFSATAIRPPPPPAPPPAAAASTAASPTSPSSRSPPPSSPITSISSPSTSPSPGGALLLALPENSMIPSSPADLDQDPGGAEAAMDGEANAVATARMLMPPAWPPLPLLLLLRSLAGEACKG